MVNAVNKPCFTLCLENGEGSKWGSVFMVWVKLKLHNCVVFLQYAPRAITRLKIWDTSNPKGQRLKEINVR